MLQFRSYKKAVIRDISCRICFWITVILNVDLPSMVNLGQWRSKVFNLCFHHLMLSLKISST